jgi:hypothetical protein
MATNGYVYNIQKQQTFAPPDDFGRTGRAADSQDGSACVKLNRVLTNLSSVDRSEDSNHSQTESKPRHRRRDVNTR